jgi:Skp family chaperone for outer membrane proteins
MSSRRPAIALALVVFLGTASVTVLLAQDFLRDAPVRVAVVDTEKLVLNCPGLADLESLRQSLSAVVRQQEDKMLHLRQQVADGRQSGRLESEVNQLEAMAEDAERALKNIAEDANRQLEAKRKQVLASADITITKAVNRFARDNGYTLVLRKFEGALIYTHESIDITDALLQNMRPEE